MKRLLISFVTIGVVATSALGLSGAFFSDTETSSGNVLGAGAIDLQIDNTSYYNGSSSAETSWTLRDLTTIEKFFNFNDIKPGDRGEDTISVHVNTNDAWLCANLTLTGNDENSITPVETIAGDQTDGADNGELAGRVNFIWWADDGDNVLEDNETVLQGGPLGALSVGQTSNIRLADSTGSIWGTGPLAGNTTKYIGKAWCFGALTPVPLTQDGVNNLVNPANSTGGISCDGSAEDNKTQTDSVTADISFQAIQARNNTTFVCAGQSTPTPTPSTSITPTPTPGPSEPFADEVTSVLGTFGHCCDANDLSNSAVLAATLTTGAPDSPPDSDFIQISDNASVILKFVNNKAIDGPGNDVRIHSYDALFPADALIELSPDCTTYTSFGIHSDTANVDLDLSLHGLAQAQCIRITDQVAGPEDIYPMLGFDVDAAEALNSIAVP